MDQDPEGIKRDIEQTRERMGDTVEALSYKTDVPARAKDVVRARQEITYSPDTFLWLPGLGVR